MTVPTPRLWPAWLNCTESLFHVKRGTVRNRFRDMALQAVELYDPIWTVDVTTVPLNKDEIVAVMAWFDTLRDGLQTVLLHDQARPYPVAYPTGFAGINRAASAGGGAFDGTADITALQANSMTIATLPANFQFSMGDYIGLTQNNRRSLHRVAENAQGNIDGIVTVEFEPYVDTTAFTAAASCQIASPLLECYPDADGIDGRPSIRMDQVRMKFVQRV